MTNRPALDTTGAAGDPAAAPLVPKQPPKQALAAVAMVRGEALSSQGRWQGALRRSARGV